MRRQGETLMTFGSTVPLSEEEWGLVARPDGPWLARGGELIVPAGSLSLVGRHNALNALAALALVSSVARVRQPVLDALRAFRGLPHRMERVGEANGVLYVNDSKATTIAAASVALGGMGRPVVLIAGGDGKGQSFAPMREVVDRTCRAVLLIGRDAPDVARGLAGAKVPVETVGTLDAAVARAIAIAQEGDVVLLSPACASLDQFANYEARGERFRALVRERAGEALDA
jgi:UDP-N-acetylmuramoylalanine--D-glutamate ligase